MISLGLTVGAHMVDATTPQCPPSPSGAFRPQFRYLQALQRVGVDLEKESATTEHDLEPVNVVLREKYGLFPFHRVKKRIEGESGRHAVRQLLLVDVFGLESSEDLSLIHI